MSYFDHLPQEVRTLIRSRLLSEYATVSSAGVPIDTPTYIFPSADLSTIDLATGLGYPMKAERARRNPKVGLLIEGSADEPVVSIAGMAAVRDADLQANLNRYVSETALLPPISLADWSVVRNAVWYLSRIIVSVTPVCIRWWDNPSAMNEAPHEWRAAAVTVFPKSDPAPAGKASEAASWSPRPWQELADRSTNEMNSAHLTLLDPDGFPLPFRVNDVSRTADGFRFVAPRGAPWHSGKATLSFVGRDIFVGDALSEGDATIFRVERALPVLPLIEDGTQLLNPTPENREKLMTRMAHEAARRNQAIPVTPELAPEPTEGCLMRLQSLSALYGSADTSST